MHSYTGKQILNVCMISIVAHAKCLQDKKLPTISKPRLGGASKIDQVEAEDRARFESIKLEMFPGKIGEITDKEIEQILSKADRDDDENRAKNKRKSDWFFYEEEQQKIQEAVTQKMKKKVRTMKKDALIEFAEQQEIFRDFGEPLNEIKVRLQDKLEIDIDQNVDPDELCAHEDQFEKLRQENKDSFDLPILDYPDECGFDALESWSNKHMIEIDTDKIFSDQDAADNRTVSDEDFQNMCKHPTLYGKRFYTFGNRITLLTDSNRESRPTFSHRMKVYWRNEDWRKSIQERAENFNQSKSYTTTNKPSLTLAPNSNFTTLHQEIDNIVDTGTQTSAELEVRSQAQAEFNKECSRRDQSRCMMDKQATVTLTGASPTCSQGLDNSGFFTSTPNSNFITLPQEIDNIVDTGTQTSADLEVRSQAQADFNKECSRRAQSRCMMDKQATVTLTGASPTCSQGLDNSGFFTSTPNSNFITLPQEIDNIVDTGTQTSADLEVRSQAQADFNKECSRRAQSRCMMDTQDTVTLTGASPTSSQGLDNSGFFTSTPAKRSREEKIEQPAVRHVQRQTDSMMSNMESLSKYEIIRLNNLKERREFLLDNDITLEDPDILLTSKKEVPRCQKRVGFQGDLARPSKKSARLQENAEKAPKLTGNEADQTSDSKFACDICKETWRDMFNLVKHKKSVHTPGQDGPYTCTRGDWCSESFNTKYELSVHLKGCFYPCPEPGCGVTGLKWEREISRHINMHKRENERSARLPRL